MKKIRNDYGRNSVAQRLRGLNGLLAIVSAVALLSVPMGLQAQGNSGGGKPDKGGDDGGSDDSAYFYTFERVAPPEGTELLLVPQRMNNGEQPQIIGNTYKGYSGHPYTNSGPAFFWTRGDTFASILPALEGEAENTRISPLGIADKQDNGTIIVGYSYNPDTYDRRAVWWKLNKEADGSWKTVAGDWNDDVEFNSFKSSVHESLTLRSAKTISDNGEFVVFGANLVSDDGESREYAVVAQVNPATEPPETENWWLLQNPKYPQRSTSAGQINHNVDYDIDFGIVRVYGIAFYEDEGSERAFWTWTNGSDPGEGFKYEPLGNQNAGGYLNSKGEMAGSIDHVAYFWDENLNEVRIGLLKGGKYSYSHGINDASFVVGPSWGNNSKNKRPFIWSQNSGILDLNDFVDTGGKKLVGPVDGRMDINDNDYIVTWIDEGDGVTVLLVPAN